MRRIIFYSYPSFLDATLPFVRALSKHAEVHLLLEVSPESWRSALFDVPPLQLSEGIVSAEPVLRDFFPPGIRTYWQNAASFNLVVHNQPRTVHRDTYRVSQGAIQFIRRCKPDLLHLDDLTLRLAPVLREVGPMPIVLGVHDPEPHPGEENWRKTLAKRLVFGRVARFILHNKALRAQFCQHYRLSPERVAVLPLGVYSLYREWLGATERPLRSLGPTVLFFGRLSPYKGLDVLLKAAPMVAESVPHVRFVVAGRAVAGYTMPPISDLTNGGQVEVIDEYLSNTELSALFAATTVVVCPYVQASQSGVVLTAYAFGKPVIASATGGLPEYVIDGESGILVPPGDPKALAAALVRVLTDRSLHDHLVEGARILEERALSWTTIAAQALDLYSEVLADR